MGIEAAMGQADLFHDVGDARAVVPAAPNGARGGPDDPFVGEFFAAGGAHMMSIIYQSGAERKSSITPPYEAVPEGLPPVAGAQPAIASTPPRTAGNRPQPLRLTGIPAMGGRNA